MQMTGKGTIGPHEGCELELMLSGRKPLAMFADIVTEHSHFPEEAFAPYVAAGRIIRRLFERETTVRGQTMILRELYFALPGEEWRIERMHVLNNLENKKFNPAVEYEIGDLLGYSVDDVECFIEHFNNMRGNV